VTTRAVFLHKGARDNDLGLIERGFANDEDPGGRDALGRTPLMVAAHEGRLAALLALLPVSDARARDNEGDEPLAIACGAELAPDDAERLACAQALLPLSDPAATNHRGSSALMRAAGSGSAGLTRLLLDQGDPWIEDSGGRTALSQALAGGHLECVKILLPRSPLDNAPLGASLPCVAASSGDKETLVELFAELGRRGRLGEPELREALTGAVSASREAIIFALLSRDASLRQPRPGERAPMREALDGQGDFRARSACASALWLDSELGVGKTDRDNWLGSMLWAQRWAEAEWLALRWPDAADLRRLFEQAQVPEEIRREKMAAAFARLEAEDLAEEMDKELAAKKTDADRLVAEPAGKARRL
jgi:hypothetical protein